MPTNHRPDGPARSNQSGPATPPFAKLYHGIASDARLDDKAVRVACALLYWAQSSGQCTVSTETIAGYIRGSYDKARDGLKQLEACGYVRRVVGKSSPGNPTGRVLYLLWCEDQSIIPSPPSLFHDQRVAAEADHPARSSKRSRRKVVGVGVGLAMTSPGGEDSSPQGEDFSPQGGEDSSPQGCATEHTPPVAPSTPPLCLPAHPPCAVGHTEEEPTQELNQEQEHCQSSPPHPPDGGGLSGGGQAAGEDQGSGATSVAPEARAKAWAKFDRCIGGERTPRTQREVDALIDEVGPEIVIRASEITRDKIDTQAGCEFPVLFMMATARNIAREGEHSRGGTGNFGIRKEVAIRRARKLRRDLAGPAGRPPRVRAISRQEFKDDREAVLAEFDDGPGPEDMDWDPDWEPA